MEGMQRCFAPIAVLVLSGSNFAAEPIIVKANFSPRRICVPIAGGQAMMLFNEFDVKKVAGTSVRLNSITIAPGTTSDFLKSLKKGDTITLSIQPSEETLKQLKDQKKDGLGFLVVDGKELSLLPEKKP